MKLNELEELGNEILLAVFPWLALFLVTILLSIIIGGLIILSKAVCNV